MLKCKTNDIENNNIEDWTKTKVHLEEDSELINYDSRYKNQYMNEEQLINTRNSKHVDDNNDEFKVEYEDDNSIFKSNDIYGEFENRIATPRSNDSECKKEIDKENSINDQNVSIVNPFIITKEDCKIENITFGKMQEENKDIEDNKLDESQDDDFRVSDIAEEGTKKPAIQSGHNEGLFINPFKGSNNIIQKQETNYINHKIAEPQYQPKPQIKKEIKKNHRKPNTVVTTSVSNIGCGYFASRKLNKMYEYIEQNADCSII